mgnify:CR=1 FL=1
MLIRIRLKEVLHDRGMTQKELSIKADMREATVSAIARNKQDLVNLRHLEKIAAALEVTPLELFEVEEE